MWCVAEGGLWCWGGGWWLGWWVCWWWDCQNQDLRDLGIYRMGLWVALRSVGCGVGVGDGGWVGGFVGGGLSESGFTGFGDFQDWGLVREKAVAEGGLWCWSGWIVVGLVGLLVVGLSESGFTGFGDFQDWGLVREKAVAEGGLWCWSGGWWLGCGFGGGGVSEAGFTGFWDFRDGVAGCGAERGLWCWGGGWWLGWRVCWWWCCQKRDLLGFGIFRIEVGCAVDVGDGVGAWAVVGLASGLLHDEAISLLGFQRAISRRRLLQ